ncbi:MAG TPA: hypothetical protein VJ739_00145 [Gemmataceae bacterium]|nr:hypothetical protein [Gemmataceae bacterium]
MRKLQTAVLLATAVLLPLVSVACQPFSMGVFTPIPVPPWVAERMEEKYCAKNDFRTPIMPPIRVGYPPPLCEDPPSEAEVLRAMPHVKRGVPYGCEEFRDDIQIVSERLVDRIDPPRFYPLIGPAQLHHCHWKSTMYYTETVESGYPFPFRCRRPRVEVVYIDKDHLHLYVCNNPEAAQSMARDTGGF